MFSPKLLKIAITGAASLFVLITAVLGASRLGRADIPEAGDSQAEITIGAETEIVDEHWCISCGEKYYPEEAGSYRHWQGINREQLETLLAAQYPGASLIAFAEDQVVVKFFGCCAICRWPQRGYIGLAEGNKLAVYGEDGILVETLGDAPGTWLKDLEDGIPFESPVECQDLLINLTS